MPVLDLVSFVRLAQKNDHTLSESSFPDFTSKRNIPLLR